MATRKTKPMEAGASGYVRVDLAAAVLLSGMALFVPVAQERQPEQTPTFRVRADVVQLDVSVLDRQGLPVRGLGAGDFTVLDDGAAQPLIAFSAVDLPTWRSDGAEWRRATTPDVLSNRADARRAIVIVLDDFTTRRDPGVLRTVKAIAHTAIDQLGPTDLAAVVYLVTRNSGQEFTLDRKRLHDAVERFVPSGLGPQPDSQFSASTPTRGLESAMRMSQPSGACYLHDCIVAALQNVGDVLASWPAARKIAVLISPGRESPRISEYLSQDDERARMFATLQHANVNVYQIDPHGLEAGPQPFTDFGSFAENTGGRAVTNTNAPEDFVPQVFRENSSYYLLGVRPDLTGREGRFHRIAVRVNRPGVQVRTRAGYYEPSGRPVQINRSAATAIERALSGGLPAGDLPVSVSVVPFGTRGKPGAAAAVIARLDRTEAVGTGSVLEFAAAAFDDKWKQVAAVRQQLTLQQVSDSGPLVESAMRLTLRPGRYEVRAALADQLSGRTGSVYASVTVPNFEREPVSLSGLAIEPQAGGAVMAPDLADIYQRRITTNRVFSRQERVTVVGRVHQGRRRTVTSVRVLAKIVDDHDLTAASTDTTIEPGEFDAERQSAYRFELPLARLGPGEYLLTIEARTAKDMTRRDIRFTVRHD